MRTTPAGPWIAGFLIAAGTLAALDFAPAPEVAGLSTARAAADEQAIWGEVKGRIVWGGGDLPAPKPIDLNDATGKPHQDKEHCLSQGPLLDETWVVNKNDKGIRWTFVWLAPDPKSDVKKLPIHPDLKELKVKEVEMDQPCCAFIPRCLALREGQTLVVKNSSPVAHNVNYTGDSRVGNPSENKTIKAGDAMTIENLKAQRLPMTIQCNIHGWMKARVAIFDHPYFAVTDEHGRFHIPKAPAGDYRLKIYHDAVGWRGGAAGRDGDKISIKPNAVTDLGDLDLKPKYDD
jgi:hypothetical protein